MRALPGAPDAMTLALVVPVWNDAAGAAEVLRAAAGLGVFDEAVVVDDASEPPVPDLSDAWADGPALPLRQMRMDRRGGAGRARNRGLGAVRASHVLFFDSDDRLLPGFADLVRAMAADPAARAADVTFYRHGDTRFADGTMPGDAAAWDALPPGEGAAPVPLDRAQVLRMSRTVAYPWNKVFRTAFLRLRAVRCGETPVHNDLELHWHALMRAASVRAAHVMGAIHVVRQEGARLTNRGGPERLAVVEALAPVVRGLAAARGGLDFAGPLLGFAVDVLEWAERQIEPGLRPVLRARARDLMLADELRPLWRLAALRDPEAGTRLAAWAAA